MTFNEAQFEVDDWVSGYKVPYWPPLSILAHLVEEVGELATELNDRYGGRVKKPTDDTKDIADEIGDIIFALICLANSQNIDLDKAWKRVMDKSRGRDKDRYEKKDEGAHP